MPRPLRPATAGAIYHVTARGVARCAARRVAHAVGAERTSGRELERCEIYTDATDRSRFLEHLAAAVFRYGWLCHTYCLMGTHYHALVETPHPNLSAGVQYLNGRYAQWFNHRHDRAGHLFGARFHSELVRRDEHFAEVSRYAVRNPVRAGLCTDPAEWPWSSCAATIGAARQPPFLTVSRILAAFSPERSRARERYSAWVQREDDAGRPPGARPAAREGRHTMPR